MKIYLAAQYPKRDEMKAFADRLSALGITVTSRWLLEDKPLDTNIGDDTEQFYKETAIIDLLDVKAADTVVFFSENPLVGVPRGGRHVEYGYALGLGRNITVIGPKENIFHFLPWIVHFDSFEDFYKHMESKLCLQ